jgi:calcineurin-like phosphoesterase family protein
MSTVRVLSDLHISHKRILEFAGAFRGGTTVDEHDAWLIEQWNSVVNKRDITWVLGDVCMDRSKLHLLSQMKGQKRLILGNHDSFKLEEYQKYFISIHAVVKYKGFWLSHTPIHPIELRGLRNCQGHVHQNYIRDESGNIDNRYINCSVEASYGIPRTFESFRDGLGNQYVGKEREWEKLK